MSVTKQLLDLFRVDKQLRGLRSRLDVAERFHDSQAAQLAEVEKQQAALQSQHKQLKTAISSEDGEASRLDARISALREKMNAAKTSKEYNAFQTELNNYKTEKSAVEEREIDSMQKVEQIQKQLDEIKNKITERSAIVAKAKADRDQKAADIKDRLAELTAEREKLAAAIPASERRSFEDLVKLRGDEAMAAVEVLDRRSHEYSCSSCMMAVPVETASAIMMGRLVSCPSCSCILYIEEEMLAAASATNAKKKAKEAASKH